MDQKKLIFFWSSFLVLHRSCQPKAFKSSETSLQIAYQMVEPVCAFLQAIPIQTHNGNFYRIDDSIILHSHYCSFYYKFQRCKTNEVCKVKQKQAVLKNLKMALSLSLLKSLCIFMQNNRIRP